MLGVTLTAVARLKAARGKPGEARGEPPNGNRATKAGTGALQPGDRATATQEADRRDPRSDRQATGQRGDQGYERTPQPEASTYETGQYLNRAVRRAANRT